MNSIKAEMTLSAALEIILTIAFIVVSIWIVAKIFFHQDPLKYNLDLVEEAIKEADKHGASSTTLSLPPNLVLGLFNKMSSIKPPATQCVDSCICACQDPRLDSEEGLFTSETRSALTLDQFSSCQKLRCRESDIDFFESSKGDLVLHSSLLGILVKPPVTRKTQPVYLQDSGSKIKLSSSLEGFSCSSGTCSDCTVNMCNHISGCWNDHGACSKCTPSTGQIDLEIVCNQNLGSCTTLNLCGFKCFEDNNKCSTCKDAKCEYATGFDYVCNSLRDQCGLPCAMVDNFCTSVS